MVPQNHEYPEKAKWCAFCFDCESVVVEDADFWLVITVADLHADERHHLVGVQTWVDKRKKEGVAQCQQKTQ